MTDWTRLLITDATGQDERFPDALRNGYFNVDEMSYEALLAMSTEFAASLRFYNLNNQPDGSWDTLFTNDEAVIMATILALDIKKEETAFLALLRNEAHDEALRFILKQAGRVNTWYQRLTAAGQHSGSALSWKLAELIKERLAGDLHEIGKHSVLRQSADANAYAVFDPVWAIVKEHGDYRFPKASLLQSEDHDQLKGLLRAGFYAFYNAISYLKKIVPAYFQESLTSQTHGPAIGLFMAFLRLYQKIQDHTNRFTQRHLDFYYYDMLQFRPRPPTPDSAYLILASATPNKDVIIPGGAEFAAGKAASRQATIYSADAETAVSDAKVGALYTLYFERDDLLSPEKELNYITHIRSHQLTPLDQLASGATPQAMPLFGATKKAARRGSAAGAQLGFAMASPVLLLMEGEREIEITLQYADPTDIDEFSGKNLLAALNDVRSEAEFFSLFGKIITRYLLLHQDWLSEEHKKYILDKARKYISDVSMEVISSLLIRGRQDYFYKLFRHAFQISLTAEDGWLTVSPYAVTTYSESGEPSRNGLKFVLSLGSEVAPIVPYAAAVHGGAWNTRLPLVRFLVNSQADYYPYSILRDLILKEVVIESRVKGIKQIIAYNNHGQVDPSSPWNPFGPLPSEHSYFILGSHEAARKKLTALDVNIEWGELPRVSGGFGEHYQGYPGVYNNQIFKVSFSVLRDGVWQPQAGDTTPAPLFDAESVDGKLRSDQVLQVDVLHHFKPVSPALATEAYRYDLKARNGFFRFTFAGPEGAFGHKAYPLLLTETLTTNARVKLKKIQPIPNPPYTPLINRVSLDYTARGVIDCAAAMSGADDGLREKLFHIHPFGLEDVVFTGKDKVHYLLPRHLDHGNLLIGISARQLRGVLTLFFHMAADATQDASADRPVISWHYLASNRWRPLEHMRVISDTTQGFLSSGIVTLDIPSDINRDNSILPKEYYWLRVCADQNLQSFSGLYTLCAQAIKVNRLYKTVAPAVEISVPAGSIRQAVVAIPGLATVQQLDGSFGGREQETFPQLKARISERLRHKNRACTPWDYERLALERFPELYKVKCFSNRVSTQKDRPRPGHVMIVVVPRLRGAAAQDFMPMANSVELCQIREYLQGLAPAFVNITVRNPLYERIQVRCSVKFSRQAQAGYDVQKLNQAIIEYISPWHAGGYQTAFGWTIRREDIEAYIHSLDYVDFVTNFSMLHIIKDDQDKHSLADTARDEVAVMRLAAASRQSKRQPDGLGQIRPGYPWSLAIPATAHFIETMSAIRSIAAEPTGIDELEVGNTFIINADHNHG